jgi:D-alanyl-lipoteichoic acid acyltransferase DltB (MBOAT superfamily)
VPSSDPRYLIFVLASAAAIGLAARPRPRQALTCLLSYAIYATFSPWYPLMLLATTGVAFVGTNGMRGIPHGHRRTLVFWSTLALSLLPLLFFKYVAPQSGVPAWASLALPVGLSFYTFQAAGHVIDSYLNDDNVETDALRFATFMAFFPTLTAGPIERGWHLLPQMNRLGTFQYGQAVRGLRAIAAGLLLKVVVADTLRPLVNDVYSRPAAFEAGDLMLATVYFSFQVYADFAGYSLIAIGSARLMGIELLPNFAQPYLSRSLPEYWRTWHMTLSLWFRDYVLTPLNFAWRRHGAAGLAGAIVITFVTVGVWHGAGWKYFLFGLLHGVLVAASTLTQRWRDSMWRRYGVPVSVTANIRRIATFAIVSLTFVLFRADTVRDALLIYGRFLGARMGQVTLPVAWPLATIAAVVCSDVIAARGLQFDRLPAPVRWTVYHAAAIAIVAVLIHKALSGAPHVAEFIYYQF